MGILEISPGVAGIGTVAFLLYYTASSSRVVRNAWLLPAGLSGLFAAWTAVAVGREGLFGFWPVHASSLWGNQVWFDLLFAVATALVFVIPRARQLGMRVPLWVAVVLLTGSIGLLAMTARILHLAGQRGETAAGLGDRTAPDGSPRRWLGSHPS